MKLLFPNSQRLNRGNLVVRDLVTACKNNQVTDIILLNENKGNKSIANWSKVFTLDLGQPDGLVVSHLPLGPTAYFCEYKVIIYMFMSILLLVALSNVIMRHDILDTELGTVSEANPHLIFDNFETKLGWRVKNILKYLFPTPKPDSKRILTFSNRADVISFR